MKFLCLILAFAFALLPNLHAQSSAEAWKELEGAVKKEIEAKKRPDDDRGYVRERHMLLNRLEGMIANSDTNQIESSLSDYASSLTSDEARKAVSNLRLALKKEREAKQAAYAAQVNAALKAAEEAVRTAKTPPELDAPLKNLSAYRNQSGSDRHSEEARAALNRVHPTLTFLQRWQDYLAAKNSENPDRARESLRNLASNEFFDLVPRSQILAELQKYPSNEEERRDPVKPEQVDEIVAGIKTLDAIPAGIEKLRQLQSRNRYYNSYGGAEPWGMTLAALTALDRSYREFQAGLPTRIETSMQSPDFTSPAIIPLRAQFLLLALPRYLGVAPELNPKPGETVQAYLDRASADARKRGDGNLLNRIKSAQRSITGGSYYGDSSPDNSAMNSFLAAQNQETAGQYMMAVISYQTALRAGSDAIPAKQIGERLAALQTAHPQEYEAGVKYFLSPRPDRSGYQMPFDQRTESNYPPVLTVPAASGVQPSASPAASVASPTPPVSPAAVPSITPKSKPR